MSKGICDVHIHSWGKETAEDVEKAFDKANVEKGAIFSYHPHLLRDVWTPISVEEFRNSIVHISGIQKMLSGRVYGFAFVDPRMVKDVNELVKLVEWEFRSYMGLY